MTNKKYYRPDELQLTTTWTHNRRQHLMFMTYAFLLVIGMMGICYELLNQGLGIISFGIYVFVGVLVVGMALIVDSGKKDVYEVITHDN